MNKLDQNIHRENWKWSIMQADSYQFCVRIPVLKICWVVVENSHFIKVMTNMFPSMTTMMLAPIWASRAWTKVTNNKVSPIRAMDTATSWITYSRVKNTLSRNSQSNKITPFWKTNINSIINTDNPHHTWRIITQTSPNKSLHPNKDNYLINNR